MKPELAKNVEVTAYWQLFYDSQGTCVICDNTGRLLLLLDKTYVPCICPNGQALRETGLKIEQIKEKARK